MKRRLLILALSLLLVISLAGLVSCGESEITGLSFTDKTVEYNGEAHTIELTGAPSGATVTYSPSNIFTDAGVYTVTATVKAEGYLDTTLTATLTVSPKQLTVEWGSLNFPANGKTPTPSYTLSGFIGEDESELSFDFGGCEFNKAGESFTMTATPKNTNYTLGAEGTKSLKVAANQVTVSFESGIDGKTVEPQTLKPGREAEDPGRLTKKGYTFGGWYLGDREWIFDEDKVEEDITLCAKWISNEYSITYYLNGGTVDGENPTKFLYSDGAEIISPKREGRIFLGWYSDADFTTAASIPGKETTLSNVRLYAKWSDFEYLESVGSAALQSGEKLFFAEPNSIIGSRTYVFSADLSAFDENSFLTIGQGIDGTDASFIKISSTGVEVYGVDGDDITVTNFIRHLRVIEGEVTVMIEVKGSSADVYIQTREGMSSVLSAAWLGRGGEVCALLEGATAENAALYWHTDLGNEDLFIVGDESVGLGSREFWIDGLYNAGYKKYLLIGSDGISAAEAYESFEKALTLGTPKYALWAVSKAKAGADGYDEAYRSFLTLCEEYEIITIATLFPNEEGIDNSLQNSATLASGERYIDLVTPYALPGALEDGVLTEYGAKQVLAQVLVDFPELIAPDVGARVVEAESLDGTAQSKVELLGNTIKDGKYLIFNARLDELTGDEKIAVGHGYMTYNGSWFEIGAETLAMYNYYSYTDPKLQVSGGIKTHGLNIKNFITVILTADNDNTGCTITVLTDGGIYRSVLGRGSGGEDGNIFAFSEGEKLTDVSLGWTCVDYSKDIWIFGDSYLGFTHGARWPWHMYQDKYENALMIGYPGMNTDQALIDIKDALNYGTPKYVVWCMGMNDGDKSGVLNENYSKCTLEMLEICKEKGIEVVLTTIPTCLAVDNSVKNYVINNRIDDFGKYDYRIVDFARAVDGYQDKESATWYKDMLYSDNVHPDTLGAKALYMQFVIDFPEIMGGWDSKVYVKDAEVLAAGERLVIEHSEAELGYDKAFTLSADFEDKLRGTIIVGNGKGVEGGTWIEINANTVTVYKTEGGKKVELISVTNKLTMEDILNLRIHVKGNMANISLMSSGEKGFDPKNHTAAEKRAFNFNVEWNSEGNDIYVESVGTSLSDVTLRWFTAN